MCTRALAASATLLLAGSLFAADKELHGQLGAVDPAGYKIAVTIDGKKQEFTAGLGVVVTVRGKVSKEGLKDKALKAGAEVTLIIPDKATKVAKVVVTPPPAVTETPKTDAAKPDEKPRSDRTVKAKINKVNVETGVISVTTDDGKKLDLSTTGDTKFIGPSGGVSTKGVKDDRVAVGNDIAFVVSSDGKKIEEIHLPVRKK